MRALPRPELPWPPEPSVSAAVRDRPLVRGGPAGPLRPLRRTAPAPPGAGPRGYRGRDNPQAQTHRRG
ncbi:hypothetical protein, partial [Nocardia carnea]|uniref:hypothetical protein n=1 Tax=Nocardia carnea TaxID=37328 RepID=UPI002453DC02